MFKVAIIGASGYTGGELLRMLLNHPEVEITDITSRKYDGTPAHKIHPHIRDSGLIFKNKSPSELDADVVFTATPHGASMKIVPEILKAVIFELKNLNIRCLLDDFGGGVASIDFLQMLKPEFIKPEKKYIAEIENNRGNQCIIQHLTNMAAELGTDVCIKGVASEKIRDIVREFPIKSMQGNFYSEPMFIDELMQKYFS